MRIVLVSPFDPNPGTVDGRTGHVGGVERVFQHVAQNLGRRGHEVTLLCSSDGRKGTSVEDGIRVIRQKRHGTVMRAPVANLASLIPADADIVHVPATYPFTTQSVLREAARRDIPRVLDFHFEPNPGNWLGQVASQLYRLTTPRTYGQADAVIVRSLSYGRSAPSLLSVPEARWRVVPNGIDPEQFFPTDAPTADPYLLFVGRLVPYKGLSVLLDALSQLHDPPPLVVAGDGPLRGALEAQARALNLDVRFLGHVPDDDLPRLYRHARLTVLPSVTGQEAFGITLLESMACGTPVVASALPGVADLAQVGGLLARPGDPASLARQVQNALQPDTLVRGHELARRVHAEYSWDAVTDHLLALYEELVARHETHVVKSRPRQRSDPVRAGGLTTDELRSVTA